jgi:hypothetical protein
MQSDAPKRWVMIPPELYYESQSTLQKYHSGKSFSEFVREKATELVQSGERADLEKLKEKYET